MAAKAKKKKAAKPKKRAAAKPKRKAAAKRKAAKPKKKAAAKRKAAKPKKKKAAKPKKKAAAKRKAAKPKKKAAAKLILKRVIVQFTRNGRNVGRPQLAPRGADDIHFVWRNPPGVFVRAWWTRGGRRIKAIRVPRYANDVHVRIR